VTNTLEREREREREGERVGVSGSRVAKAQGSTTAVQHGEGDMRERLEIEKEDTGSEAVASSSKRGQVEETRAGKRGRPSNAEKLGRERSNSRESISSISSWLWKGGREQQDTDSESEEKEGKRRKKAEIIIDTEKAQMEKIEKILENMGENQERSKKEIIKKIEDSNRDLEKKVMTELKKELVKMREENAKVIEELKNVELRREVTELKKKEEERERRERKKNIVIKGEQVEEGTARQVVEDLCNGICGEKIRVKEVRVIGKEEKMILVELENFEEKRKIMKNKYKLRGKKIYVDEDMTRKERGIQKRVREWAYQEKKKGRMVKVGYAKAYIGEIKYVWNYERDRMEIERDFARAARVE